MNPFINPEFWLSLAFIIVITMVIFPPIRQSIKNFFYHQRQLILDQIQQANGVLSEAKNLLKEKKKGASLKADVTQINLQIRSVQHEFSEKTKVYTEAQKQDYHMRQMMTMIHMKNNLRSELLNQAEEKILQQSSPKSLTKDVQHLIQMLDNNKDKLKEALE